MKKLLLLGTVVFSQVLNAQKDFAKYTDYTGKQYDIMLAGEYKDKFRLYISAFSFDKRFDKGGFVINEIQYQLFIPQLNAARRKYAEWKRVAIDNNVTDLHKPMENIFCYTDANFYYGSDWHFTRNVEVEFEFVILKSVDGNIKHLLLVKTGELQASDNRFMTVDGFALVFSSEEEIGKFLSIVSSEKISQFFDCPKKEDLFKD